MKITKIIRPNKKDLYQIDDLDFLQNITTYIKYEIKNYNLYLSFYTRENELINYDKDIQNILNKILTKYDLPNKKIFIEKIIEKDKTIIKYNSKDFSEDLNKKITENLYSDLIEELIYSDFIIENQNIISEQILNIVKNSKKYINFKNNEYSKESLKYKNELNTLKNKLNNIPETTIKVRALTTVDYFNEGIIDVGLNPLLEFEINNKTKNGFPIWTIKKINNLIDDLNKKFNKKILKYLTFEDFTYNQILEIDFKEHSYETPIQLASLENRLIFNELIEILKNNKDFNIIENTYSKNYKYIEKEELKEFDEEDIEEEFGGWKKINLNKFDQGDFQGIKINKDLILNNNNNKSFKKQKKITTDELKKIISNKFNINLKNLKRISKKKNNNNEIIRIFENKENKKRFEIKSDSLDSNILKIENIGIKSNEDLEF